MRYSIYKITNLVNNKIYIGQTMQTLQCRLNRHANKHSKCRKLLHSIQKHGINNFVIEEIAFSETEDGANELEIFYIKNLNTIELGYNLKEGGSNGLLSQETKNKISASLKGHLVSDSTKQKLSEQNIGDNNPNYGLKRSDETKNKTSNTLKGRTITWADKISNTNATKLNEELVKSIFQEYLLHTLEERSLYGFHQNFCKKISNQLNTTSKYILKILKGQSWKHIYVLYEDAIKS